MKSALNRRSFLKRSALTFGALSAGRFLPGPNLLAAAGPDGKLNCVQIGCGGRGMVHLEWLVTQSKDNLVAIVDADEKSHARVKEWLAGKGRDPSRLLVFTDYRRMFDQIGKQIDAVFIATPNHQHAPPALIAMQLDKNVYCEKPVCHDVGEARRLRAAARQSKGATQMGNQGHCDGGYRSLCEYIWAGVIGKVTETHSWTNRANGGEGPRPPTEPPPAGMHWDEWIGPAPYRDYHSDIHPHEWHGWYDFGNGSIGNMGCHILDGAFWALKIEHPTSIEVEEMRGGSDERYPTGSRIRWDVPARGDLPPVKVFWYEGLRKDTDAKAAGGLRAAVGKARNLPPLLAELQAKYPEEEIDDSNGSTLYVGEKGVIFTRCYGERMHVLPIEKMREIPVPPKTLPRPKNVFADFINAGLEGRTHTEASFEYGTRLTEFTLLANLAQHVGAGRKVEWDGPNMKVTNIPELNQWVTREYRQGWKV